MSLPDAKTGQPHVVQPASAQPGSTQHAASQPAAPIPTQPVGGKDWRASCEGLVRVVESTAWSSDPMTVYENMVSAVVVAFACDEVHLHLFDVEKNRFVKCASHSGIVTDGRNTVVGLNVGRMQWMMDTRQPIVMDYIHPHQQDQIPPIGHEAGFTSAVSVPLVSKEEVLGMCSLVFREERDYDDDFLFFLTAMGRILGVAIERMRATKKDVELQILDERKQLSAELHDELAQKVIALSLSADMALMSYEEGDEAAMQSDLARLEKVCKETVQVLRDEMLSLRIPLEQTDGFIEGVETLLKQFEDQWGIQASFEVVTEEQNLAMPLEMALQMTRILKECLSNVLRHSKASAVSVLLEKTPDEVRMEVRDNGCGFDPKSVPAEKLGIKIMRERAAAAGGILAIDTNSGGTVVKVCITRSLWH